MERYTPYDGIVELKRRLAAMGVLPQRVIEAAHLQIIAGIPVYTGTYKRAVTFKVLPDGSVAAVYVDEESLQAAASMQTELFEDPQKTLDYIYENIHGKPPEGPYVRRIEQHGRPTEKNPSGQDLWLMAWRDAYIAFVELMEKTARGMVYG